jgi:TP901-1 family phage major tail protein
MPPQRLALIPAGQEHVLTQDDGKARFVKVVTDLSRAFALCAASDAAVRSRFFAAEIVDWQIVIPDFGVVQGPFQITSLEFAGRHDAEVTFDLALASAGQLIFTVL